MIIGLGIDIVSVERIGRMLEPDVVYCEIWIRRREQLDVLGNRDQPVHQGIPDSGVVVVSEFADFVVCTEDLLVFGISPHLPGRCHTLYRPAGS